MSFNLFKNYFTYKLCTYISSIYIPGQKYETTLKNEEKDIGYNS